MDSNDDNRAEQLSDGDPLLEFRRVQAEVERVREQIHRAADRVSERRKLGVDRRAQSRSDRRKR